MSLPLYTNRTEAGEMLAARLERYRNTDSIVLAVPRGGVPVGDAVAKALNLPLDVVMAKKIGHPSNPEFAIGSVSPDAVLLDDHEGVPDSYITEKTNEIRLLLQKRKELYRGQRPDPIIKGKNVILVDDGIATGNTLLATLQLIRNRKPNKIIVAVPVAPSSGSEKIRSEADEFICLEEAEYFPGVGAFYADFSQVSDAEVIGILNEYTPSLSK